MPVVRLGALLLGPLIYLSATVTIAALIAYLIHVAASGTLNFSLVVSRGAQAVLLISLLPFSRALGIGMRDIGLAQSSGSRLRQFGVGAAIGIAILATHVAFLTWLRVLKPNPLVQFTGADLLASLPGAAATGLGVALMEELIFRGVLLAVLARFGGPLSAILVSSLYYALLHFVKSDVRPSGSGVNWNSGFEILADGIGYLMTHTTADSLLALFCAGLFLATIRTLRPGALALCIGIHAGWIIVIKLGRRYTNPDPHVPLAHLVGPYDQIIGYGAAAWLALLLAAMVYLSRRAGRKAEKPGP
jgi:membrane protease YdiL (CAAX protease family)